MKRKINVLIVCGSGASSSFMAAKMRMAARETGLDLGITARAEAEIVNYIEDVDAVMVGPHLTGYFEGLKKRYSKEKTIILMDKDYYAKLDGKKAIEHLLSELENLHEDGANHQMKNKKETETI